MADAGCQMAYKGHVTDWVVVSRLRFELFGVMLYTRVWLAVLMVSQAVSYSYSSSPVYHCLCCHLGMSGAFKQCLRFLTFIQVVPKRCITEINVG